MSEETGTELVIHRAGLMEDMFFAERDAALIKEYREKIDSKNKKLDLL